MSHVSLFVLIVPRAFVLCFNCDEPLPLQKPRLTMSCCHCDRCYLIMTNFQNVNCGKDALDFIPFSISLSDRVAGGSHLFALSPLVVICSRTWRLTILPNMDTTALQLTTCCRFDCDPVLVHPAGPDTGMILSPEVVRKRKTAFFRRHPGTETCVGCAAQVWYRLGAAFFPTDTSSQEMTRFKRTARRSRKQVT